MSSSRKAIELFEQMVEMGDYYSSGRPVYVEPEIIINDICSKIPLSKKDVILDVGCGTGVVTTLLAQKCKYVHALDPGKKVIYCLKENCKRKDISNISFYRGVATYLPFKDQSFDNVIMYTVMHYLENNEQIERCMKELIRVCKRNGYVLIAEIPEKMAKEEFDSRQKTPEELKILDEFNKNRKHYDKLLQEKVSVKVSGGGRNQVIDGNFLIEMAQKSGCSAKICKQDIRQPFSLTRRDLVIKKEHNNS